MRLILSGKVSNEEIGAFLLGWKVKGETSNEFIGALEAFDEFIVKTDFTDSIEVGYPYDGKADNPYLFPLIAKYLEPFDINLALCGE